MKQTITLMALSFMALISFSGCDLITGIEEKEYKQEMVYEKHTECYRLQTFEKVPESYTNSEHWLFIREDYPCYSEEDLVEYGWKGN